MYFIVTIDTEEDNWDRYSTDENPVKNIDNVLRLQHIFNRYSILPTYLVTYPVATNERSVSVLKGILDDDLCEIGTHCHPWNTPPFNGLNDTKETMICNLSEELIYAKLKTLHETIEKKFNITPVTFRAGRWGYNEKVAHALHKLGYWIDSSVSPFTDWGQYGGPDFRLFPYHPYEFDLGNVSLPVPKGEMLQVPASVGYMQKNFDFSRALESSLSSKFCTLMHIKGILHRLRMLNRVWLSPEHATYSQMVKLSENLSNNGVPILNFTFHSTSLMKGLSPFVKTKQDETEFFSTIDKFMSYAAQRGWKSIRLKNSINALSICEECE